MNRPFREIPKVNIPKCLLMGSCIICTYRRRWHILYMIDIYNFPV